MIPECEKCHRVRVDGQWTRSLVAADVVGICPTCLGWQKRIDAAKWTRQDRQLLQDRADGYGPGEGDPFRGFRG